MFITVTVLHFTYSASPPVQVVQRLQPSNVCWRSDVVTLAFSHIYSTQCSENHVGSLGWVVFSHSGRLAESDEFSHWEKLHLVLARGGGAGVDAKVSRISPGDRFCLKAASAPSSFDRCLIVAEMCRHFLLLFGSCFHWETLHERRLLFTGAVEIKVPSLLTASCQTTGSFRRARFICAARLNNKTNQCCPENWKTEHTEKI